MRIQVKGFHVKGSFVAMRGPVDFKLCSEILEYRRVRVYRRWRFSRWLAALSSYSAKRRRKMRGDWRSVNLHAARMTGFIRRRDRANNKLLTMYSLRYSDQVTAAMEELRMAKAKAHRMCAKMAETKRLKMWKGAMHMFWTEIKMIMELKSEPWTHSDEVVASLKLSLYWMKQLQTTTSKGWLQGEIRGLLESAMEKLFWTD